MSSSPKVRPFRVQPVRPEPFASAQDRLVEGLAKASTGSARTVVLAVLLAVTGLTVHAQPSKFDGVGRTATPAEVKAWDIDVRPDFKGLPKGQGSVKRGEEVWEAQCASCHGTFGESNDVFTPLVGYTTKADTESGQVAALKLGANAPTRTTMMKVSQVSTLWDYINRAMPWTAPKSLSADDVYAVTAFLLNLANVIPDDFTLSDRNIRDVQAKMPNRNGVTTAHGMWPGKELGGTGKPDVQGSACMANCRAAPSVASFIPDYARNAHGNLAEQTRGIGSTRGADTTVPAAGGVKVGQAPVTAATPAIAAPSATASPATAPAAVPAAAAPAQAAVTSGSVMPILQKNVCIACHSIDAKLVGPAFKDIATRYKGRADAATYLAGRIKSGGQGVWGAIPMPAQSISEADAQRVAQWLVQGAAK